MDGRTAKRACQTHCRSPPQKPHNCQAAPNWTDSSALASLSIHCSRCSHAANHSRCSRDADLCSAPPTHLEHPMGFTFFISSLSRSFFSVVAAAGCHNMPSPAPNVSSSANTLLGSRIPNLFCWSQPILLCPSLAGPRRPAAELAQLCAEFQQLRRHVVGRKLHVQQYELFGRGPAGVRQRFGQVRLRLDLHQVANQTWILMLMNSTSSSTNLSAAGPPACCSASVRSASVSICN